MEATTPRCSEPSLRPRPTTGAANLEPAQEALAEGLDSLARSIRLKTLWPRMQRLCPPRSERFWVIGGRPGSYKTQLMWTLAMDLAALRQRVLFVSLEQTTGELALQAAARYSRIPLDRIEAASKPGGELPYSDDEWERMGEAKQKIALTEMYLRLHGSERHGRSLDAVLRSATREHFDAVFCDHIGMIGRDGGRELEQLAVAIDRLRGLARGEVAQDYRPFVCVTSPLNRDKEKAGSDDALPSMSDFRGSGRLESDSDVAMVLRKRKRPADEEGTEPDVVDAFVVKQRGGRCPLVLTFEAEGAICSVVERHKEQTPPEHWSSREPGEEG